MAIVKLIIFSLFACCSLANPAKKRNSLLKEGNNDLIQIEHDTIQELVKIYTSKEYELVSGQDRATQHPDVGLNTVELIRKYGYPVEQHKDIETDDEYLLEMHRIPHGKANADIKNRPVVYLQHGLLGSSADWVVMGPEKGFGYILADAGFDVWLGNVRGSTWSRKHKRLNPDKDQKQFWDFSWNEIGTYDLPAMIDHITSVTKQDKIFYVGHSQGTTAFFVMSSERPQYLRRIKFMTAFAPIVYMANTESLMLQMLSKLEWLGSAVVNLIGLYEFLPSSELFTKLGQKLCNDQAMTQAICTNILFMIAGYNSQQLNTTMLPVILSTVPAGAATKQLLHYGQEISSGEFKKYDYGWMQNLLTYGSTKPPKYDLSKVNIPLALYYGDSDNFASTKDVDLLYDTLRDHVQLKRKIRDFNHLDFIWAINATQTYNNVISLMQRFG